MTEAARSDSGAGRVKPALDTAGPYPPPSRGVTRRIWEIADALSLQRRMAAPRDQVIARFVDEGGNPETAKTQYSKWLKNFRAAQGGFHDAGDKASTPTAGPAALQVGRDGRLLIPQQMREAMDLDDTGRVTAEIVDGELRLVSPRVAIGRLQARMAKYKKPGVSVVDEFLAERRAMWGERE